MANRNIERAVRVALFAASAASIGVYSPGALAQEQEIEQIVVTGSRIPQPNLEGTSPVSVIGAQEVTLQGVTQVEDLINNLPQAFADQGGGTSNGASGTATVDLRGLGPDRTLVLVNGRRLPAGDVVTVAPDLNQIPAPLIERVEVLTGGAGAVYGSDAVSGVVNFIMKDNFEGVQLDANYSFYNHKNDNSVADVVAARGFELPGTYVNDGDSYELSLLMGSNFADDKGNATIFVGYRNIDALQQAERDFSACAVSSTGNEFLCGGSGTSFPGRYIDLNSGNEWSMDPEASDPGSSVRPYLGSRDQFNYNPYNYYQRPDERYSIAAFAHYDVTDKATVYTELMFMDDHTIAQIAPSGLFGLITPISCSNPLLSAEWVDSICTQNGLGPDDSADMFIFRRNVEGGGRRDDLRHTSYRGVVGLKGEIGDNWNYDVFGQYGTVLLAETYRNDFSRVRAARAMDVIADDNGNPVCRSVVDESDLNCVPYDIWNINVTPQALAYLQTPGLQTGSTEQTVVNAALSSDLGAYGIKSPWADSGVGIAFGVEYREEFLTSDTDTAFSTNDLFGQGGATIGIEGGFNVTDYFAEIRAPLAEGKTGADSLTLNASYRYSDYSTDISTDTYGIGLDWAPIADIKFRGSYQVAVRAPNIVELFQAQGTNLFGTRDPCGTTAAGAGPTRTLAECQRTGVTAAQYGSTLLVSPAGQYNYLQGGNPTLEPEESDSYTVGFVFAPSFFDGFTMTVDYFDIKVDKVISTLTPSTVVNQCLDSGDPLFCSLVQRDSLGTLWALPDGYVVATNQNLSTWETSGFDLDMNYGMGIGEYGSLSFNFIGTLLDKLEFEDVPGLGIYDCVGYYGFTCGDPNPEWRHKFRVTWSTPWNVDLSFSWRHFDEVKIDSSSSQELLAASFEPIDEKLDAQDYFDVAATYAFFENYTVRLGINNITDEDPPISGSTDPSFNGNGNTFPNTYDSLGRYVFMGITAKF